MARTSISAAEVGQIFVFVLLSTAALWPVSILAARLLGLRGTSANAFHLGTLLTNSANVGFPVLTLAYGQPALERGLVYSIGMQALFQTLGVYLAAGGSLTPKQAVRQVLLMPGIYAMIRRAAWSTGPGCSCRTSSTIRCRWWATPSFP